MAQASATVSEMARIRRAAIDRILNMKRRKLHERTPSRVFINCLTTGVDGRSVKLRLVPEKRCRRNPLPRRRRRPKTSRKDRLAGILVMGVARLDLLGDGVHVAKPPLALVGRKHRGGAG